MLVGDDVLFLDALRDRRAGRRPHLGADRCTSSDLNRRSVRPDRRGTVRLVDRASPAVVALSRMSSHDRVGRGNRHRARPDRGWCPAALIVALPFYAGELVAAGREISLQICSSGRTRRDADGRWRSRRSPTALRFQRSGRRRRGRRRRSSRRAAERSPRATVQNLRGTVRRCCRREVGSERGHLVVADGMCPRGSGRSRRRPCYRPGDALALREHVRRRRSRVRRRRTRRSSAAFRTAGRSSRLLRPPAEIDRDRSWTPSASLTATMLSDRPARRRRELAGASVVARLKPPPTRSARLPPASSTVRAQYLSPARRMLAATAPSAARSRVACQRRRSNVCNRMTPGHALHAVRASDAVVHDNDHALAEQDRRCPVGCRTAQA